MWPFDGEYQPRQGTYVAFSAIALTVSEILTFQICDLENLGQGHTGQHSQWSHSMANINLYKCHTTSFSLALTVFEIFTFRNAWPWKCRSKSWCFQHSQWRHSMANTLLPVWWRQWCLWFVDVDICHDFSHCARCTSWPWPKFSRILKC